MRLLYEFYRILSSVFSHFIKKFFTFIKNNEKIYLTAGFLCVIIEMHSIKLLIFKEGVPPWTKFLNCSIPL